MFTPQGAGTFAAMFVLDFVWGEYTRMVADKAKWRASAWSIGICVLSGVVTTSYINEPWMLIPAAVGGFIGTFISVKRDRC